MSTTPTWEEIQAAVSALAPVVPHDTLPWSKPGGHDWVTEQSQWDALTWNPPHYFPELGRDDRPAVSVKPRWDQIIEKVAANRRKDLVAGKLVATAEECERRVVAAYGAFDGLDELRMRVGNEHTQAADDERIRLRARYHEVKEWLYPTTHAGVSYRNAYDHDADPGGPSTALLESFFPTENAVWSRLWVPPTTEEPL